MSETCSVCLRTITDENVIAYSRKHYGEVLCRSCQEAKKKHMKSKTKTDTSDMVTNIKGKNYVTHTGLLALAHTKGLQSITTEALSLPTSTNKYAIFKATVVMKDNTTFSSHGDADDKNVPNDHIRPHLIRMAETRAVNRALRLATNTSTCSEEELGRELDKETAKRIEKDLSSEDCPY